MKCFEYFRLQVNTSLNCLDTVRAVLPKTFFPAHEFWLVLGSIFFLIYFCGHMITQSHWWSPKKSVKRGESFIIRGFWQSCITPPIALFGTQNMSKSPLIRFNFVEHKILQLRVCARSKTIWSVFERWSDACDIYENQISVNEQKTNTCDLKVRWSHLFLPNYRSSKQVAHDYAGKYVCRVQIGILRLLWKIAEAPANKQIQFNS